MLGVSTAVISQAVVAQCVLRTAYCDGRSRGNGSARIGIAQA